MSSDILTKRRIGHDEAREVARRLINSHFQQEPRARASIPAEPDRDDDLLICAYIAQQERDWQKQCLKVGFEYWRAPDAHGVICTTAQATELLQNLLGVEVEIQPIPTHPDTLPDGGK